VTKGDRYRELFAKGNSVREIAERFGVRPQTVRCALERDQRVLASREYQRSRYLASVGGELRRIYRCSFCRGVGHSYRTCDSRWLYLQPSAA